MGFDWGEHLHYASDYFNQLHDFAVALIRLGKAYVCDLTGDEIRAYRGTLTEPGRNSPYRDRSVVENLELFAQMRAGDFDEGRCVLRAKIDMASPNVVMRDPRSSLVHSLQPSMPTTDKSNPLKHRPDVMPRIEAVPTNQAIPMDNAITVALAGNPNAGKTTLFNQLTGSRQHVGNYPGITVEQKEGCCLHRGQGLRVVDLPGTYSLTAYSVEELVARDFLVNEKPDVVVDVVDASNLERNLYLSCQFLELGVPLVIALNMVDVAEKRGLTIHCDNLSRLLATPVIPIVARSGKGLDELLDAVTKVATEKLRPQPLVLHYGSDID
ncbi:hypothetical protein B566_EDAN019463, partial [Ephemera danica]